MKTAYFIFSFLICSMLYGQKEYFLDTGDDALLFVNVEKDYNGYYVAIFKADSVDYHYWGGVIKFDNNFNYEIFTRKVDTSDIQLRDFVITEENNYLITGTIGKDEGASYDGHILYFLLVDENLNMVSEHTLTMPENYNNPQIRMFQTVDNRNYVIVYQQTYNAVFKAYIELSDEGEVVKQAFYNIAGMCIDPFPKPNSNNGFYVLQISASPQYIAEVVDVDTSFNYTTIFLPGYVNGEFYKIGTRGSCKWLNDSTYIIVTEGTNQNNSWDLILYKMNGNHEFLTEPFYIGQSSYPDNSLRHRGIDWIDPNNIYIASWYWPNINFTKPYFVAIINDDFDVLGLKSIGGEESNFIINSLLATDDGGCLLVGGKRDIQAGNEYDWDGYVAFFSQDDIITTSVETQNPYDSDYLIFPNPGNEEMIIQTAIKEVNLQMFDQAGKLVLKKELTGNFRNNVNTTAIKPGVYICKLTDKYGNREFKKWIKR
jgi:hypothetical protein